MKSVHSCREETLFKQTFCPASRSRCIFKNSDNCRHKVFFRDRMGSHGIACDRVLSLSPGGLNSTCFHFHAEQVFGQNQSFVSDVAAIRMRSHAIAFNRMKSQTLCRQLSEFLKMHQDREAGQKVCLNCFFTTTVNRFHIIFFAFSKRKK